MPLNPAHRKRIMESAMPLIMTKMQKDAEALIKSTQNEMTAKLEAHKVALATFEGDPTVENRSAMKTAYTEYENAKAQHQNASESLQLLGQPQAQFEALLDNSAALLDEAGLEAWCLEQEIELQQAQIPTIEAALARANERLAELQAQLAALQP